MNPLPEDTSVKINMNLDEIIHLTRREINSRMKRRHLRQKSSRKMADGEDSAPLLLSSKEIGVSVSKTSLSLNAEKRRKIARSISNRILSSELQQKSKEIIPAEYKLVRTDQGIGRVLVPPAELMSNPQKKVGFLKKLNKESNHSVPGFKALSEVTDRPPPLIAVPIYKSPQQVQEEQQRSMATEVDRGEVELLNSKSQKQQVEVSDVESNLPVDVLETKKLFVSGMSGVKTLNDRFTMLSRNFYSS